MSLFEYEDDPVKRRVRSLFLDQFERAYGPFAFPQDEDEEEDSKDAGE